MSWGSSVMGSRVRQGRAPSVRPRKNHATAYLKALGLRLSHHADSQSPRGAGLQASDTRVASPLVHMRRSRLPFCRRRRSSLHASTKCYSVLLNVYPSTGEPPPRPMAGAIWDTCDRGSGGVGKEMQPAHLDAPVRSISTACVRCGSPIAEPARSPGRFCTPRAHRAVPKRLIALSSARSRSPSLHCL